MKHTIWILAALGLVACGEQAPPETTPEADAADSAAIEEPAPAPADAEPGDEDDVLQAVEESAAEPDADEETIMLAKAEAPDVGRSWQFQEGTHFYRIVPAQPTLGGADKIEVAEFFWYGCPHCFDFEPFINRWDDDKPANVRFVRIPAMWNGLLKLHAQLFYTEEVLARNGAIEDPEAFHAAVFEEFHRRNNRMTSENAIQKLFERFGVGAEDFNRTWSSFEVAQKLRIAEDLARRYSIANVPTVVVNGKYRTGGAEAGSYPKLLEIIDELVARESLR